MWPGNVRKIAWQFHCSVQIILNDFQRQGTDIIYLSLSFQITSLILHRNSPTKNYWINFNLNTDITRSYPNRIVWFALLIQSVNIWQHSLLLYLPPCIKVASKPQINNNANPSCYSWGWYHIQVSDNCHSHNMATVYDPCFHCINSLRCQNTVVDRGWKGWYIVQLL